MTPLLTLDDAAASLGVPKASLKTAAERHGLLIRMGRAVQPEERHDPCSHP